MPLATVTAYCACVLCCGPEAAGVMANGQPVTVGSIAAPRSVPFGTRVRIGKLGVFVVRDTMPGDAPNRWDIFFPRHEDAKQFGKQTLDVTIIP